LQQFRAAISDLHKAGNMFDAYKKRWNGNGLNLSQGKIFRSTSPMEMKLLS
jgi:hypothetical protein